MIVSDLYLRTTGPDGGTSVSEHRVWDRDRFITARVNDAESDNRKAIARDEPAKSAVAVITQAEYRAARGTRRSN